MTIMIRQNTIHPPESPKAIFTFMLLIVSTVEIPRPSGPCDSIRLVKIASKNPSSHHTQIHVDQYLVLSACCLLAVSQTDLR